MNANEALYKLMDGSALLNAKRVIFFWKLVEAYAKCAKYKWENTSSHFTSIDTPPQKVTLYIGYIKPRLSKALKVINCYVAYDGAEPDTAFYEEPDKYVFKGERCFEEAFDTFLEKIIPIVKEYTDNDFEEILHFQSTFGLCR